MYKIYSDSTLIHDQASPDKNIHLVDPFLSLQDNSAGKLEFTILPSNPGYDSITKLTSTIIVKKENKTIWSGRAIRENNDFFGRKNFTVEGALSYLNDTVQTTAVYTHTSLENFIRAIIDNHNAKVPPSRQIQIGIITVRDYNDSYEYETYMQSTWDVFNDTCIDRLGGHTRIRYADGSDTPILDYLDDYPNTASQSIDFGKNLLDFTRGWDLSNLSTVIIPRGAMLEPTDESEMDEYLTVESVNGGSIYVFNHQAYDTYGRIEKIVDFPDIDDPNTLLGAAELYVLYSQFDKMTMSVNAVDMHMFGVEDPESFNLLDEVRCVSKPHGLDRFFPITAIDIPIDRPQNVTYTMGSSAASSISSTVNATEDLIFKKIKNLPSLTNTLKMAKTQAASILDQRTTGYVTITETDSNSEALIISQDKDWQNSDKRWIFNMNGLGYTEDGGQTYDIAMTMDGTIVADFIKTGILEDGAGKNYWNLSTGEFSLRQNIDIGSRNYLDGTGNWSGWTKKGRWTFSNELAICDAKSSVSDWNDRIMSPIKNLKYSSIRGYYVTFSFEGIYENTSSSEDSWGDKSDTNQVVVSFGLVNESNQRFAHFNRTFAFTEALTRYITTVYMGDDSFKADYGMSGVKKDAYLVVQIYNQSVHKIKIRKVQLERGKQVTDWRYSQNDVASDAQLKADSALEKAYSKDKELDDSLNQAGIFDRLFPEINGSRPHGLVLQNGKVYINASYIKSGTLDGKYIKAGVISDNLTNPNNIWDLTKGTFTTKNATVSGTISCGDSYKMSLENGQLIGSYNNKQYGFIDASASIWSSSRGKWFRGMTYQASEAIKIVTPKIYVVASNDIRNNGDEAFTGTVRINGLMTNYDTIRAANLELVFVNGLFIGVCDGSQMITVTKKTQAILMRP